MINDLLAFSRVTTKGHEFKPVEADTALKLALANLKVAIEESQASVTFDPLPVVNADSAQLTQLFQNLIGNAIKFRRKEPPQVHVSVEKRAKDWEFSVRDNGIGIEPQHLERIFVIFQRLHTAAQFPGTGIGPGDLQEDRGASRRQPVGELATRRRIDFSFHYSD